MKQYIITILTIIFISSCSNIKYVAYIVDNKPDKLTKKEIFLYGMWNMIDFYIEDSAKSPSSATDLILWIENIDEESKIFYQSQYKYLKKHEKKLVFITEVEKQDIEGLEVAVYIYKRKIKPNRKIFFFERYSQETKIK